MRPKARATRMFVRPAEAGATSRRQREAMFTTPNTRRDNGSMPIGRRAEVRHAYTVPVVRELPPRGVALLAGW